MMRSTLDICVAVQDCAPATEQELRCAVASLSAVNHFLNRSLKKLIDATKTKPHMVQFWVQAAERTQSDMFDAKKRPMDVWLGDDMPGTETHAARLRWAKDAFKKATGIDLDSGGR